MSADAHKSSAHPKHTLSTIRRQYDADERLVMVTAYDAPTAAIADAAGVEMILVGDSLAMVVLGYDSTLPVTMDEMLHHTKAARRGTKNALLVADMPFGSYGVTVPETIRNGMRFLKEAGAEAVKLEGGRRSAPEIAALVEAQIPVVGHIGLTPQSVHAFGGYKVQAKTVALADKLMEDALAVQDAGAFCIVLEGVPAKVAEIVTDELSIPTIGIGAGSATSGQVLVFHDLLGLHAGHYPKFVRKYADGYETFTDAVRSYVQDTKSGAFPSYSESYHLSSDEAKALDERQNGERTSPSPLFSK